MHLRRRTSPARPASTFPSTARACVHTPTPMIRPSTPRGGAECEGTVALVGQLGFGSNVRACHTDENQPFRRMRTRAVNGPTTSLNGRTSARRVLDHTSPCGRTLDVAGNAHTPTARTSLRVPMGAWLTQERPRLRSIRSSYGAGATTRRAFASTSPVTSCCSTSTGRGRRAAPRGLRRPYRVARLGPLWGPPGAIAIAGVGHGTVGRPTLRDGLPRPRA